MEELLKMLPVDNQVFSGGLGLAAMATGSAALYDELKTVRARRARDFLGRSLSTCRRARLSARESGGALTPRRGWPRPEKGRRGKPPTGIE